MASAPREIGSTEIGIVDQVPSSGDMRLDKLEGRARSECAERLRLGRPRAGVVHIPIEQAMDEIVAGAVPPPPAPETTPSSERTDDDAQRWALAPGVALAAAAGARARRARGLGRRQERQGRLPGTGREQPLAALQDIDVVEHLGDRVPSGLAFRDSAGHQVALDDLLHQGSPCW